MLIHDKNRNFSIYFGNKKDDIFPGRYESSYKALELISKQLQSKGLTILHQVHGTRGYYVRESTIELFKRKGDILLTDQPGYAIGVVTADCLPVVMYDLKNHACVVVHAGWRGSVAGVVPRAVALMRDYFGTKPEDLIVYFGPSGRVCCYEVQRDFCNHVEKCYQKEVLLLKLDKVYFDNVRLNNLQLLELGVTAKNICLDYNACTICDSSYHSYRRDGVSYGLQATVVVLG